MKHGIIPRILITAILLAAVPFFATAMGNSEKPFGIVLDEEFSDIADNLQIGEIDLQTAKDLLHDLRTENGRENNADYQAMERILEAVQAREMTAVQAREQLRLLDECSGDLSEIQLKQMEQITSREKIEAGTEAKTGSDNTGSAAEAAGTGGQGKTNNRN